MNIYDLMGLVVRVGLLALPGDEAIAQSAGVGTGRIGSAIDVRGTVESNVQGRTYPLHKGGSVYQDQYVNTRAKSVAGLELLNQSKFHIGPNSSVRLDKSVYDPVKQSGVVSLRVKRGSLGMAEGQIQTTSSDTATYNVHTPEGTLTVRPIRR